MTRPVAALFIAILFVVASALIFMPDYNSPGIVKFLVLSQVMFALSIALFLVVRRLDLVKQHRRLVYALVGLALIARLVVLVGAGDKTYLSDDVYRYVWDGKVSASGINPYRYAPQAVQLSHLADSTFFPNINFASVPTIYPPMAQNIFLLSYLMGGDSIGGFKFLAVLFELLTVVALYYWLRQLSIPTVNLLLWLFSPLILIEFYLSSHLDILGIPFLIGALMTLHQRRPILAGMLLAMATLVKFYGLFFAIFFLLHFNGRDRLRFGLAFVGSAVTLYLPYWHNLGPQVFGSLFKYLSEWSFNGSVFIVLKQFFGLAFARLAVATLFVGWTLWLLSRRWSVFDKMFATMGGYLVLTPTFFPWYFVWIFPLMLRNLSPAFLFLSGSVLLSYHVLIGQYESGQWSTISWLAVAAYVPFYFLLIVSFLKAKRTVTTYA